MDYRVFKPDTKFVLTVLVVSAALSMAVSFLFYDTWKGCVIVPVIFAVVWKRRKQVFMRNRQRQIKREFTESIILISGNLEAGYSLENAMMETYRVLSHEKNMYPYMQEELYRISNGLSCGQSVDLLFMDFGERSGITAIREFAKALTYAKHFGGNINRLIRQTATNFGDSAMAETEIDTMISAKRLEGYIMLAIPFFILIYLKLLNPQYIQPLYTMGGSVVMTVCLVIIGTTALWIEKIVRIEV